MIGKNVSIVLGVFIAAFLVLASLLAFAVAKTGLFRVPIFSSFYQGPTPTRAVSSEPITETQFRSLLTSQVEAQFAAGRRDEATITVTETQLTGAIRSAIAQALREQGATAEDVQIVVEPKYLELSGRLMEKSVTADLRVRLDPVIEDGGIRFDATDIYLGDYPVHPDLAQRLAGIFFSRDFGTWHVSFGEVRFTSLTLRSGALELKAMPNAR